MCVQSYLPHLLVSMETLLLSLQILQCEVVQASQLLLQLLVHPAGFFLVLCLAFQH